MEIEQESPEEKAFFDTGGEAAPEADKTEAAPEAETSETIAAPEAEKTEEKEEAKVPYNALHEERMLRREATEELKTVREQVEQLQSLKDELQAFRQEKNVQAESESFDEDPIGHLRKQQEQMIQDQNHRDEQAQTQQAKLQEVQQLQQNINAQVNEFRSSHTDYDQALAYIQQRRAGDLVALGIDDVTQQQQILNAEAWNIAQTALQNNKNPAQVVYDLANSWGYQQDTTKTKLDEQVETIQKGQLESQTLSDAGGAPETTGINLADIESMSDDEFDQLWAKVEKGQV